MRGDHHSSEWFPCPSNHGLDEAKDPTSAPNKFAILAHRDNG
jgi:hypothetical protein